MNRRRSLGGGLGAMNQAAAAVVVVESVFGVDGAFVSGQFEADGTVGGRPQHAGDVAGILGWKTPARTQSATLSVSAWRLEAGPICVRRRLEAEDRTLEHDRVVGLLASAFAR